MEDLVDIRFSSKHESLLGRIESTGYFSNRMAIFKYAFAYAIKYFFEEIDPKKSPVHSFDGTNYNAGSFDKDGFLKNFIIAAYPDCEVPYIYLRNIVLYGLDKLEDKLKNITVIKFADLE